MSRPVVLAFNPSGSSVARAVAGVVGGETLGLAGRVSDLDGTFEDAAAAVSEAFRAGRPIFGICAAGILIRLVAPLLRDKHVEPPVLAVADDGSAVVPLIGGLSGADVLARLVAARLGGQAAITGAGARRFGLVLESPPGGWILANPDDAKSVTASLLAGNRARIEGEAPWLRASDLPLADDGEVVLRVSERAEAPPEGGLLFHPRTLIAEFDRPDAAMLAAFDRACAELGLAPASFAFATAPEGAPIHHALVEELARRDAQLRIVEQRLEGVETIHRELGLRIHRAPSPASPHDVGRAAGRVTVVGLGPGPRSWIAAEAAAALDRASDLVGYEPYLAMVPERPGQRRHGSDNRVELERAQAALALAAQGREVAVVSSGDAGIFGMAAAVMEVLEAEPARWPSVAVEVTPGLSAMQAAAARLGAPLGHDFAVISLSPLLKPWDVVARRLAAAADADFAIAIYNPASKTRRSQIVDAVAILRERRPPETVVALARNVGRPGESLEVTTLKAVDPETIDMRTLVLVGSSRTRAFARADGRLWVYTPRRYDMETPDEDEA